MEVNQNCLAIWNKDLSWEKIATYSLLIIFRPTHIFSSSGNIESFAFEPTNLSSD